MRFWLCTITAFLVVALYATIIFVAYHFIHKYW